MGKNRTIGMILILIVSAALLLSCQVPPTPIPSYLVDLRAATYRNLLAMVEENTGLPNDRFDASLFDIIPQLAMIRAVPSVEVESGASLTVERLEKSASPEAVHTGDYGFRFQYAMPLGTYGSFNLESHNLDANGAAFLDLWVKGATGGERFEIVLWSDIGGSFPGRPSSGELTASTVWERKRISLGDYDPYVDLASLERVSIGFNDALDAGGTIFVDDIAFIDVAGNRIPLHPDESTNETNIGLYLACLAGAEALGLETRASAVAKADETLDSLIALPKYHGFPQTHNYVVSLGQDPNENHIISGVDTGNLAAGLIVIKQAFSECAAKAGQLLDAMEWDWFYDASCGLPYGARHPDGTASTTWHYEWLAADSRLMHYLGIGSGYMPAASWGNLNTSQDVSKSIAATHYAPGWSGGGLFMACLPAIFLNERTNAMGVSTKNFVDDQIGYKDVIGAPAWGWSATVQPPFGEAYCGYGCFNDAVIVPHASLVAAEYVAESQLIDNLQALEARNARQPVTDGAAIYDYGFCACVEWRAGRPVPVFLFLDQAMAFLGLANLDTRGRIRTLFNQDPVAAAANAAIPLYSN